MRIVLHDHPLGIRFSGALVSTVGMQILSAIEMFEKHLSAPVAAYGDSWRLRREINRVAADAAEDDWDGDGSLALDVESLDAATDLAKILPPGFPPPDVDVGRRGELMLEWRTGKRSALVLSLYPDRSIGYAVVRGQARAFGREPFLSVLPEVVLLHLRSIIHRSTLH